MKRIKIYVGLLLALALLLPLLVTPCVQAADMTEGSYYAIGYLEPAGAKIWAYGYYLSGRQTVYAMMRIQEHSLWATWCWIAVDIRYPNGQLAASDDYEGALLNGITVSTSKLNPPSGGYVMFDSVTGFYIIILDEMIHIPVGSDTYYWYYPV
jgi:hypothetical protein